MNRDVSDYSNEVLRLIRELMTTIIKGKLEKENGSEWFDLLKKHMMKNQNLENNRGKYVDPLSLKDYTQLDPTVCAHIMIGDDELKSIFDLNKEVIGKIIGLRRARNSIAHSRDDGTLNWQHIYVGLNALNEARNTFGRHYRNEFFNDSMNHKFREEIDNLTNAINNKTSGNIKSSNVKSKRTIVISIAIILISLVGIIFVLTSNFNNSNTNSASNTDTKKDESTTISKENVQNKNVTLDFSSNSPTRKVTSNFILSIDKIEFNRNDVTLYVNYNNKYNGDVAFTTVRLDVGENTSQLEWTEGAAQIDKMLSNKQGQVAIKFPKAEYVEGKSIKFTAKLTHYNSLEAGEVSNKNVDIQIQ